MCGASSSLPSRATAPMRSPRCSARKRLRRLPPISPDRGVASGKAERTSPGLIAGMALRLGRSSPSRSIWVIRSTSAPTRSPIRISRQSATPRRTGCFLKTPTRPSWIRRPGSLPRSCGRRPAATTPLARQIPWPGFSTAPTAARSCIITGRGEQLPSLIRRTGLIAPPTRWPGNLTTALAVTITSPPRPCGRWSWRRSGLPAPMPSPTRRSLSKKFGLRPKSGRRRQRKTWNANWTKTGGAAKNWIPSSKSCTNPMR